MTTLETKPIAFFFRPLSPPLGVAAGRAGTSGMGAVALSIRCDGTAYRPMRTSGRCPNLARLVWTFRTRLGL